MLTFIPILTFVVIQCNIGISGLSNCVKLTKINVDEDNKTYVSKEGVLFDKTEKTLLIYPNGRYGKYNIPFGVKNIVRKSFIDCNGLTEVIIPDSITSIGDYAFLRCGNLKRINVEKDNQRYSSQNGVLFDKGKTKLIVYPSGITGGYIVPDSVNCIGSSSFESCINLTAITIPNSVTKIDSYAFARCIGLTSVFIPNSVTNIEAGAFSSCTNLKKVTISNALTSIGDNVFNNCTNIEIIR